MTKQNYNIPAGLLDIEINDFDTVHYNETGINEDRAFLPRRYDVERAFRERENPFNFVEDFDWQITYKFSRAKRDNDFSGHAYGGNNVTFRRLYLILCEHFNNGVYFIEDYFETVYPRTLKPYVDKKLETVKSELLDVANMEIGELRYTKSGNLDRRYKINRNVSERIKDYESFAQAWEADVGEELARLIKEDIISSLRTGQIPLSTKVLSNSTKEARKRAGLPDDPRFYASGQLIKHIDIYVSIGGTGRWETQSGILV